MNREVVEKIRKECFPDMEISSEEIIKMARGEDPVLRKRIFERIMYNSSDRVRALTELFDRETLRELLHEFRPSYNKRFMEKMTLLLRNIILDEDVKVETLEWKKNI